MITRRTFRFFLLVFANAFTFAAPVHPQAPDRLSFTSSPGERVFSGNLIARPLQREEAQRMRIPAAKFQQLRAEALRAIAALGVVSSFPEVDEYVVRVPAGQTEAAVAGKLMASGAFSYVEPDWIVFPVNCVNDPLISNQWHHRVDRLNSCGAWALETGAPSVVVAICDTGVRVTHQDLLSHRMEGFHVPSRTWESAGGPVDDINGHGTLCTGAAAANGNNSVGISGIGWNLGHRMMRVTDSSDGSASISNLTLAARTAIDRGDKVASVSYSGVTNSSVRTTGNYIRSKGGLLVWAAGNSNAQLSGSREDSVIVVGATDQNDQKASFSNFGSLVDLVAPGVSIYTTSRGGNTSYSFASGTSFSTPIVAGLCGLIWSRNPTLAPDEVEAILRATCKDLGAAGVDSTFGYGRVDAAAALAGTPAPGPDTTPPAAPTGLIAEAGDAELRLTWNPSPERDLAGYSVWRSIDGVNYLELTPELLVTPSYLDSGLENGTTYYYAVYALDQSQNESDPARVTATPVAPPSEERLAEADFESGTLDGSGWVVQNANSYVGPEARFEGNFGLVLQTTTWAELAVNTAGFRDISVSYARRTVNLTGNQRLVAEWWNGRRWSTLESLRTDVYTGVVFRLPSAAGNNSAFKLRFRLNGNNASRKGFVDSVIVSGIRS
jgi:thermitase